MVISYGGVKITFQDCTADKISVEYDGEGKEIWAVHILDRRWKWKECGQISGYYNVRRGADDIVPGTEKSPRELATLCLQAMGETRYDVSALPDTPRPEIEWDYTLPAEALAKICDDYGCRVVLQLNNTIRIVQAGMGNQLPIDATSTEGSVEPDPPERPDSLVFVAGKTRYQVGMALEAVGLDFDAAKKTIVVKPIDQLSYAPTFNGVKSWKDSDIHEFNEITTKKFRELAKKCVFKWYRIKLPFTVPQTKEVISDRTRILPIESIQIAKQLDDLNRQEPRPAWVYGSFADECVGLDSTDSTEAVPVADFATKPKGFYSGSFDVDTERGIVQFSDPVYRYGSEEAANPESMYLYPATLYLLTTISVRDEFTRAWRRWTQKRTLSGYRSGTNPRYITREDIAEEIYYEYQNGAFVEKRNTPTVESQARYYLDATERAYQFTAPSSVSYAGFRPINLDGAIQQVTWALDESGFARTRASRNREELLYVPSYKERRAMEKVREALKKERETERQKSEKAKKAQA